MVIPSWNIPTRFIEGVGNVFQDLTDHLAGDAIHGYPNLARLDPAVWEYCMINGRIFGLPFPSELITEDRKSTRLNSSHVASSYAVYCLNNINSMHVVH